MDLIKFALKEGADDIIIEKNTGETKQVKFANNSIVVSQNWNMENYKVFIACKNRIVYTVLFDTSEDSLKNSIKNLIKNAKMLQENNEYFGIAKGPFKYKPIQKLFDRKIIDADTTDIVESMRNRPPCSCQSVHSTQTTSLVTQPLAQGC